MAEVFLGRRAADRTGAGGPPAVQSVVGRYGAVLDQRRMAESASRRPHQGRRAAGGPLGAANHPRGATKADRVGIRSPVPEPAPNYRAEVYCGGSDLEGEVGVGRIGIVPTPQKILEDVVALASVAWKSCALKRDGTVWCWGEPRDNDDYDPLPENTKPRPVHGIDDATELVSHGGFCVRRKDRSVWCWSRDRAPVEVKLPSRPDAQPR